MKQVVIKNADSRVIKNVSGNILKQNFQFGYAFQGSGIRIYKPTDFRVGISTLTIVCFEKESASGSVGQDAGVFSFKNSNYVNAFGGGYNGLDNIFIHSVNDNNFITTSPIFGDLGNINGVGNINPIVPSRTANTIRKFVWEFSGTTYRVFTNGGNIRLTNNSINVVDSSPIQWFEFGRGGSRSNPTPSVPQNNLARIGCMWMYNRLLSNNEINYLFNNNLGNLPSSREGLIGEWFIDTAENCDFSNIQNGSDMRIGFKDESGNFNHAEIMGIPAGSTADKINYVNTNWLTVW